MAKVNNLSAAAYAKPHTMSGKPVTVATNPGKGANGSVVASLDVSLGNLSKSAGNETTKTTPNSARQFSRTLKTSSQIRIWRTALSCRVRSRSVS